MKLKKLFDYQKFENNANLNKIIEDTETKYYGSSVRELSLDEIDYVAAAGAKKHKDFGEDKKDE